MPLSGSYRYMEDLFYLERCRPLEPTGLGQSLQAGTDPFRQGISIYLGRTNYRICPVAAVLSYLVKRGPTLGPLFTLDDGRYLTCDRFVRAVREALTATGVDALRYAGHSFRIGAANCRIQNSLIRTMGWWESSVYTLYIRLQEMGSAWWQQHWYSLDDYQKLTRIRARQKGMTLQSVTRV